MIKILLPLALLFTFGCGKMEVGNESAGQVGGVRTFSSAAASPERLSQIQSVCTKLQQKDTSYVYYVNGFSRFRYDTTYKSCDGETTTATVAPTLSNSGGLLQFVLPPGQSLATSIETATSGRISQLCRAISALGYPHETSATSAIWYDVFTGSNCPSSDPDVLCVKLETGTKQANTNSYVITSTDKFFLDFTPGQDSGAVVRHERYEAGGCAAGKSVARTSVFMGIN